MDQYATVCKTKQMNMISREEDPEEEMDGEYELLHLIRLQHYLQNNNKWNNRTPSWLQTREYRPQFQSKQYNCSR